MIWSQLTSLTSCCPYPVWQPPHSSILTMLFPLTIGFSLALCFSVTTSSLKKAFPGYTFDSTLPIDPVTFHFLFCFWIKTSKNWKYPTFICLLIYLHPTQFPSPPSEYGLLLREELPGTIHGYSSSTMLIVHVVLDRNGVPVAPCLCSVHSYIPHHLAVSGTW